MPFCITLFTSDPILSQPYFSSVDNFIWHLSIHTDSIVLLESVSKAFLVNFFCQCILLQVLNNSKAVYTTIDLSNFSAASYKKNFVQRWRLVIVRPILFSNPSDFFRLLVTVWLCSDTFMKRNQFFEFEPHASFMCLRTSSVYFIIFQQFTVVHGTILRKWFQINLQYCKQPILIATIE